MSYSNASFNASQLKAINHKEGPCLVISGPGSGKTTVITQRIRHLTEEENVDPEHILVVTFTNAAAKEMRERYLGLVKRYDTRVSFGTFHAIFFQILKQYYGKNSLELINDNERLQLLREVFREHFKHIEIDNELLKGVLSEISAIKNTGSGNNRGKGQDSTRQMARFSMEKVMNYYEEKKKKAGRIDFDDMLMMTGNLLRENKAVLREWQQKFTYICVDEFQDINPVQYEIIKKLALPENNLFIVGDDDQAIYKFRGSDPSIMLNFPKDYKGCEKILMGTNYRSTEAIIKSSLKVIRNNKNRFKKKLNSAREKGERPVVMSFKDEKEEAQGIARDIRERILQGASANEMAVLARTNEGLRHMVSALTEAGIPYQMRDQVRSIYRHFILKPLYALLNYAEGDRSRENFFRFMNCPSRFLERRDFTENTVDIEKMLQRFMTVPDKHFTAERLGYLKYQLSLLEEMTLPFARINYIRRFMEFDRYVEEYAANRSMSPEPLMAVLDEIMESALPFKTVKEWYDHIASELKNQEQKKTENREEKGNKILLTTFHASKGLEYRYVYILGANEKVTPHEKAVRSDDIEEERRMFYVAMTRAKDLLIISYTRERYKKRVAVSRFLKEMQ